MMLLLLASLLAAEPTAVAAPAPDAPEAAPSAPVAPTGPVADPYKLDIPEPGRSDELKGAENDAELSMGWTLLRTLMVLGIVVMSIYVSLNWGLRKMLGIKAPSFGGSVVSVIERVPLDQRRSLFVVKAANEYLLVGGGDQALGLISKLDTAEVEKLRAEKPAAALTLSPFLQKLLARKGTK